MDSLYRFDQICSDDLVSVGYKAFHLSRLSQQRYPVVQGIVVSANVLKSLLETIDWSHPLLADLPHSSLHLDLENARQLQAIARLLRQSLDQATLPTAFLTELETAVNEWPTPTVILHPSLMLQTERRPSELSARLEPVFRSSGILNSRICTRDRAALEHTLKQLWGDLFGAKSLYFWQEMGIQLYEIQFAVLVQPIQSAIATGTVRNTDNHLEICATAGLGMALAQGETAPDVYQINPLTGAIAAQHLGQKVVAYDLAIPSPASTAEGVQVVSRLLSETQQTAYILPEADLHALIQLSQRVIADLGSSIELEWILYEQAIAGNRLWLTQAIALSVSPLLPPSPSAVESPTEVSSLTPPAGAILIARGLPVSKGHVIVQARVLKPTDPLPTTLPPNTVLVATTIPLNWLPLLQQVTALITEQGSVTSHSAIVARDLGIPAIMGVPQATQQINTGDWLWLDGDRGTVYQLPNPTLPTTESSPSPVPTPRPAPPRQNNLPAIRTGLMVNLHHTSQLQPIQQLPIAGVGLLRAELLAMSLFEGQHPALWLQQYPESDFVKRLAEALGLFAQSVQPHPVFYRSFDLRRHEIQSPNPLPDEHTAHPMLGMRGTFSYQLSPTLFNLELAALAAVQAAGHSNIQLMLPFVRTVEEFQFCRQLVKEAGLMANPQFQLWIMAEVPSILLLLPDYVEAGVQGISIGTSDLTQLLLGVDRDEARMAIAFEERHPAVKRAIAQLIQQAKGLGIPCSICGDAPVRYPELIQSLVRWGIDSISVPPEAVEDIYWEIARAEHNVLSRTWR